MEYSVEIPSTSTKGLEMALSKRSGITELHLAAIDGNHGMILTLLQQPPKRRASSLRTFETETTLDVNAQDELGRNALHWAAAKGKVACTELLAQHMSNLMAQDKDGRTPLYEAVIRGHNGVVEVLLRKETIWHNRKMKDTCGRTALHWAVEYGNEDVVRMLLAKEAEALFNEKDIEGHSALDRAARNSHRNLIKELIKCGARVTEKKVEDQMAVWLK